jgi:hypothetical protein
MSPQSITPLIFSAGEQTAFDAEAEACSEKQLSLSWILVKVMNGG